MFFIPSYSVGQHSQYLPVPHETLRPLSFLHHQHHYHHCHRSPLLAMAMLIISININSTLPSSSDGSSVRLLGLDIFLSLDLGLVDSSFQTIFKKSDLVEMLRLVTHTTTSTTTISPILHPFMKHHKHDISHFSPQAKKSQTIGNNTPGNPNHFSQP